MESSPAGRAVITLFVEGPDTYWLYIIVFLGPIGALIYLFAEALPDMQIFGSQSFRGISRGKRIKTLELAIRDKPLGREL